MHVLQRCMYCRDATGGYSGHLCAPDRHVKFEVVHARVTLQCICSCECVLQPDAAWCLLQAQPPGAVAAACALSAACA